MKSTFITPLAFLFVLFSVAGPADSAPRPNIIFILTDDMATYDLAQMPKLNRLVVDQGATFTNFFVTNSLCCPSRSSILRGQYVHNHGIERNSNGFQKFHSLGHEKSTVATWLHSAGYLTGFMGKYLNGYADGIDQTYVPPGWDEWDSPVDNQGYREFSYVLNENHKLVKHGRAPADYLTDVIARKSVAFIRSAAEKKQPFFLHLAPFAPHVPATPAPRHADWFADVKAPRTASFNETDVSQKPAFIRAIPALNAKEIAELDELYRKRLRSLQAVDDLVEEIIAALTATGQLGNTYIVFSSDNGFHLGQHRLEAGKQTPYEEDIRVPLVVRGPGVPAKRALPYLAVETDLAPTFADWASAKTPDFVDGRSLAPLLTARAFPPDSWRRAILVEHSAGPEPFMLQVEKLLFTRSPGLTSYQALRTSAYLYVEHASGERELYDLRVDVDELHNLAATADQRLIRRLSSWLGRLKRCKAFQCRSVEDLPLEPSLAD